VSFAAITLCVASQQVFIVVSVHFVIHSVRKLFDTPSNLKSCTNFSHKAPVLTYTDKYIKESMDYIY
jgi:hypothetical protein